MFKIFKYYTALKILIKGIEKAKEDGKVTIDELIAVFVEAFAAAQLGHISVYDSSKKEEKSND